MKGNMTKKRKIAVIIVCMIILGAALILLLNMGEEYGPGTNSIETLELTLEIDGEPTIGGNFFVKYRIKNNGNESLELPIPEHGLNFNVVIYTPNNTIVCFIPLETEPLNIITELAPGQYMCGALNVANNECAHITCWNKWGDRRAERELDGFYGFPPGKYLMYGEYGDGMAYSEVMEFEIPPV